MPPALSHADYSRGRLLQLLDELDRTPAAPETETIYAPPGESLPASPRLAAHPARALIEEHAVRSGTGAVVLLAPDMIYIVSPPYPVGEALCIVGRDLQKLRVNVTATPPVAAILLRYGGYAIGFYEHGALTESRNDSRFVKNRHRKGGQSQRRFDRIREKQVHELFAHLCEEAAMRLSSHEGQLDFIAYGGDAHTVQAFLKECRFLREFPCPVLPRFLTVPEPRHETLERLPSLLNTSRVTTIYPFMAAT